MGPITSERLTIGLLFVAIVVLGCLSPVQSDTWWQLRAGEDFWRTGTIPLVESYSWTASGRPWPNHEWLSSVVFFLAWSLGGMPLLQALAAAAIVGALWLSWRLTRGSFELSLLVFCACLIGSTRSWAVRPQVLTMLMFAMACTLIAKRRLIWLPLLFVLWTNLHAASVLGIVAFGGAIAIDTLAHRRVAWRDVLILAACVLATTLSPLGVGLWQEVIESVSRSRTNFIIEWEPTGFEPWTWPFWALLILLPWFAWRRRADLDHHTLALVGLSLGAAPLAVRAVRNLPMFFIAVVPAITSVLSAGRPPARQPTVRERTSVNAALLAIAGIGAAVLVTLLWLRPPPSLGWTPISTAAQEAVSACRGNMFNTYEQGGFLIWFVRDRPVFIDNRQDPYPADLLAAGRRVEITGDYGALFQQYDIRCAVVPPDSPTAIALVKDDRWIKPFADDRWAVFQRASQ